VSGSPKVAETPVIVVTHFPSPYQVELFNEVERQRPGVLRVLYLNQRVKARKWTGVPVTHDHAYLDGGDGVLADARRAVMAAPFVIFNYYIDRVSAALIRARAAAGGPWCFWGERPGYRFPRLARVARFGRLAPLRSGLQPIWGIGRWAVTAYRAEFGDARPYLNLPYYSNLDRFRAAQPKYSPEITFLFSGSLIHRKGVDLLARAFLHTAAEHPRVRLKIMGEGPLQRRLQQMLASSRRVEWVGFVDWQAMVPVYESAHILCVPSRHDGWGLVVPEGLAAGLPTISTDHTGAALDLIKPRHNGWLVRAGDGDGLSRAMLQAAGLAPDEWSSMSRRARASVADHSLAIGAARLLDGVDRGLAQSTGLN
jgi:glycosyltransferase involved in cell wall biosynthesis